jgi:nitroimidazol reductase NimA-like FMN-containing flavoprotein (pyridoxamine 5'-phosphate oxidase superfamily)
MRRRRAHPDNARMSAYTPMRRAEKQMPEAECRDFLARAFCGRLASCDADGRPYITPLLHVLDGDVLWVHTAAAHGHLRANIDANPHVCFEADEPGAVFPYGRFECDTGLAYTSVVAFGRIAIAPAEHDKQVFFERFMRKYADAAWQRPQGFFPRIDAVTVYRIELDRITGKRTALPAAQQLWPNLDRTMTPSTVPPR